MTFGTCAKNWFGTQTQTIDSNDKKFHKQRTFLLRGSKIQVHFYGILQVNSLVEKIIDNDGIKLAFVHPNIIVLDEPTPK